jgi:hypothetical protein
MRESKKEFPPEICEKGYVEIMLATSKVDIANFKFLQQVNY